jgi:beta-glucanase (GH16 family)
MLLDERDSGQGAPRRNSGHGSPRRKGGSSTSKIVLTALSAVLVAGAVGIGVAAKVHSGHSQQSKDVAAKLAPQPVTPPKSWKLTFNSSFTGTSLDSSVWGTCYPWDTSSAGCTNFGNTGDEDKEWYLPSQDQVSGGVLRLVAQREPTPGLDQQGAPKEYACRSGMVTTDPSFRFEYGYVQIVAKLPFGKGLWPALWLAAANQKWPPEIDIEEHWNTDPFERVYLHPTAGPRQGGEVSAPNLAVGWHTFTLSWTKTRLSWYYDGQQVFTTTTDIPQQSMYLIANLADDVTSPGGCSGSLLIKSVRVWQP